LNLYLDASVLIPAVIEEPSSTAVRELFRNRPDELSVGDFAAAEVASALSRLVRIERLTATEAAERLADFDEWRASATELAEMDAHDCRLANTYVRRFDLKLRAPDALHAAICRRLGLQLATLDRRLAAAARELSISVVMPTDGT
jgi:predicted nucleic acid-binding protein